MITEFLTPKHDINIVSKKYRLKKNHYAIVYNNKIIVGLMPDAIIITLRFVTNIRKTQHAVVGIWKVKKIKEIDTKPLDYEVSISTFLPPVDTSLKREIPQHLMQKKTFLGSYVGDFIDQNHFKNYLP